MNQDRKIKNIAAIYDRAAQLEKEQQDKQVYLKKDLLLFVVLDSIFVIGLIVLSIFEQRTRFFTQIAEKLIKF